MKESKLINEVNSAYAVEDAYSGTQDPFRRPEFTVSHNEAKRLMKPTSIRLKPSLKLKIEEMAEKEGRSFNNMMTRILESAVA